MRTMKKIFAILSVVAVLGLTGCGKDFLNTEPTNAVSGTLIFSDADNALSAVNGVYRLCNLAGWGSGWTHENGGLPSVILTMDLKAEDHLMDAQGSGWFYEDYRYGTFADYTITAGHQYQFWNMFYTIISNTNYILDHKDMEGTPDAVNYVLGQAFAMRSECYAWLIQIYQQNGGAAGSASRSLPGVPIYTGPTVAGSPGAPRGTVQNVYDQMNADIDSAIARLSATNIKQMHKSHIDLAVAYGLKARHALIEQDFPTALAAAESALALNNAIGSAADIAQINDVSKTNVLWGIAIQTDQALGNASVYSHMDADCKSTYSKARHLIVKWLYDQIPVGDARLDWWTPSTYAGTEGTPGTANGSQKACVQKKLVFKNAASNTGDHILLRTEELYLMAAEAACETEDYTKARTYLGALGSERAGAAAYAARLATFTDSKTLTFDATAPDTYVAPVTLMDEIMLQRRIELWGEWPRIFDIQRRGLAFDRTNGGNHASNRIYKNLTTKVASANFILWIPQAEFDGNENMNAATDQNPEQGPGK